MEDELYKFKYPKIYVKGIYFICNLGVYKINEAYKLKFCDMEKVDEDVLIKAKFLYED